MNMRRNQQNLMINKMINKSRALDRRSNLASLGRRDASNSNDNPNSHRSVSNLPPLQANDSSRFASKVWQDMKNIKQLILQQQYVNKYVKLNLKYDNSDSHGQTLGLDKRSNDLMNKSTINHFIG